MKFSLTIFASLAMLSSAPAMSDYLKIDFSGTITESYDLNADLFPEYDPLPWPGYTHPAGSYYTNTAVGHAITGSVIIDLDSLSPNDDPVLDLTRYGPGSSNYVENDTNIIRSSITYSGTTITQETNLFDVTTEYEIFNVFENTPDYDGVFIESAIQDNIYNADYRARLSLALLTTDLNNFTSTDIVEFSWNDDGTKDMDGYLEMSYIDENRIRHYDYEAYFDIDTVTATIVPVPAALPLFTAGLLLLGWRIRQ